MKLYLECSLWFNLPFEQFLFLLQILGSDPLHDDGLFQVVWFPPAVGESITLQYHILPQVDNHHQRVSLFLA